MFEIAVQNIDPPLPQSETRLLKCELDRLNMEIQPPISETRSAVFALQEGNVQDGARHFAVRSGKSDVQ